VVKAFHRTLAAVHGLADLNVRHVFHEFQYEQVLAFRRQVADQLQKCLAILTLYQSNFGRLAFVVERGRIVEGDFLVTVAVRCQLAIRLWAMRYNQAENGTPRSV